MKFNKENKTTKTNDIHVYSGKPQDWQHWQMSLKVNLRAKTQQEKTQALIIATQPNKTDTSGLVVNYVDLMEGNLTAPEAPGALASNASGPNRAKHTMDTLRVQFHENAKTTIQKYGMTPSL